MGLCYDIGLSNVTFTACVPHNKNNQVKFFFIEGIEVHAINLTLKKCNVMFFNTVYKGGTSVSHLDRLIVTLTRPLKHS